MRFFAFQLPFVVRLVDCEDCFAQTTCSVLISLKMEQAIGGFDYWISTTCGVSPRLAETESAVVLDTSAVPTVASSRDMELGATLGVRVR